MAGPFNGMQIGRGGGAEDLDYTPNPKQHLAHNCMADVVFYGGAVFGGKSWWLLMHNAAHCMAYGKAANTVIFRRTYKDLDRSLIKEQKELFHGKLGTYKETNHTFTWDSGATTWFCHLEREDDVLDHQSAQYTLACFDELTHFTEKQFRFLFIRVRSPRDKNIFPQMLAASNPRGPGHQWVKDLFLDGKVGNELYARVMPEMDFRGIVIPEKVITQMYVPAYATDNEEGLRNDPAYLQRMRSALSDDLFEAYVKGDWDYFEDTAFPEWTPDIHVVAPFNIPKTWKVIRSLDWGYATPFSVGWWAQDPASGDNYRIDEWYGAVPGKRNAGLRMATQEVRQGILNRENANTMTGKYPQPWMGVADPSIWAKRQDQPSVGEDLNRGGPLFRYANNDRQLGKQAFHSGLRLNPDTGQPAVRIFNTCKEFIRQVPDLQLDDAGEDVQKKGQEDHIYDEGRYALVELRAAPAMKQSPEDRAVLLDIASLPGVI